MSKTEFSKFLENQFLLWQQSEGGRRTVIQFADWLGFPQSTISTYWNKGSAPKDERIIRQLAIKLGLEVYDVLGKERPDPDLYVIQTQWDTLDPDNKKRVRELTEQLALKKRKK